MPYLTANDGVSLHYETHGSHEKPPLILLHGFTGSGEVFKRNVPALSNDYFVVVPDLRGHGASNKPMAGYHVARLAVDLKNLIDHLQFENGSISAVGASLGAAILWCYAELFTTRGFSHMIFVDQAPLQNYVSDWGPEFGNYGCNSPETLAQMQEMLEKNPRAAHLGTINACLGYRAHPLAGEPTEESKEWKDDEDFFLGEALRGDGWWYGKLMADHTANDWRHSIGQNFGPASESTTKVLVIASSRSGCFPVAGMSKTVELVNSGAEEGLARGEVIDWGGHWCYWEKPEIFSKMVIDFLSS